MNTTNNTTDLTPSALLDGKTHRLVIQATLAPAAGQNRFQPAGFPEVGHVIYDAPQSDGSTTKVCIVDSAASMANHLESVCVDRFSMELVSDLQGLPYVQCLTDNGSDKIPARLVVTTLSEGHRLASSLFTDDKSKVVNADNSLNENNLGQVLLEKFKLVNLGKRSHPLPNDWWNVFNTIFEYDPNSLVHGILFPAMGIKLSRVLTANLEALGAARVASSGVKFDKLLMTTSGQPIFAKDEETARKIHATFVIDLSLIRSFGREKNGLQKNQKELILGLALWKISKLLEAPFRYRSGCDLELVKLRKIQNGTHTDLDISSLNIDIASLINSAKFPKTPITKIYWPSTELFKKAKDKKDIPEDALTDTEDSAAEGEKAEDSAN